MKQYIKVIEKNGINAIKVEFDYSKGGCNCFTYREEKRGYYIHVSPVYISHRNGITMESYTAFSGIKKCLLEVTRKSVKAENQALEIFENEKAEYIDYIVNKNDLIIIE